MTPVIIFSDSSKRNSNQYALGAAFTAYTQNSHITSGKRFTGRCTNFEAEVYDMGLGVFNTIADMPNVRIWGDDPVWLGIRHPDHMVIAADNEAAMKCLLDPGMHAAQSLFISVIRSTCSWLDADNRCMITFIYCPTHKGIKKLTKTPRQYRSSNWDHPGLRDP
ncbi:hypothetical protein AX16_010848 [Volvariella volvacea WC 439]|nr:hypothetical protein AX16_010848 [Volvariella volvacea WC 439]